MREGSRHEALGDVGTAAFEAMVDEVIDALPDWVVDRIDNLVIVVAEEPTAGQGDTTLLGLYEGVSLLDRGNDYFGAVPDTITIFRRAHLGRARTMRQLRADVRKTVLHELAHHLGIDDERLTEIGWD